MPQQLIEALREMQSMQQLGTVTWDVLLLHIMFE